MSRPLYFVSLISSLLVFLPPSIHAAGEALVRLEAFSVAKSAAMRMLGDSRMVSVPDTILDSLRNLESHGQAKNVAITSLTIPWGTSAKREGDLHVELDVRQPHNGLVDINVAIQSGTPKKASALVTETTVKLGAYKFLGTLEPPDKAQQDETWLVFIHLK